MKGLVIKNTGSWYTVKTDDGQVVDCKVKGNFRLKGIRSTNPVAVGDRVTVANEIKRRDSEGAKERGNDNSSGLWITEIEDRKNYIIRKSSNLSKQSHILAANVDQAFLFVTINYPETSLTFIDRFLASAEAYRVPVVLIFNKTDLLNEDELRYQRMVMNLYENIGYQCFAISLNNRLSSLLSPLSSVKSLLQGKITLLSGNSGVGKSTFINTLVPGLNLRTNEISDAHNTGMHTTTFSEMIPLPIDTEFHEASKASPMGGGLEEAYLIDTPGIKGFGTFDMEKEELTSYFREIFHFSKECRFNNCTHTHEPGCAVLKALEDHYIAQSRYNSYLSMLEDKEDGKYRAAY
ncbi:MAG: ribosome small subunit-dependent GTPase A [Prevotella sp.]|nr:ribosome small subunit-dependent GTPase A [Prevotella sp.]